jgi:hypothetical protein
MNWDQFRAEIAAQPDAAGVLRLVRDWDARVPLDARRTMWGIVAEAAPFLNETLIEKICETGLAADRLLKNPAAGSGVLDVAMRLLVADVTTTSASHLRSLARAGRLKASSVFVGQLREFALSMPERAPMVASVLLHVEGLASSFWLEWGKSAHRSPDLPVWLASVPDAPAPLYRGLLAGGEWPDVLLLRIAASARARADAAVRGALLSVGRLRSPTLLATLSADADGPELRLSFQAAMEQFGPGAAARVLDGASAAALRDLDRADLRPLLESRDAEARLTAIRVLSSLTGIDPLSETRAAEFLGLSAPRSAG